MLAIPANSARQTPDEVRGLWIMRFSLGSPQSIRNLVVNAKRRNFNTLFVQVRGRGDAWYRSDLEPRAEALSKAPDTFDPLAAVVEAAHREGLKVHAWLNTYLTWTGTRKPRSPLHIANAHPEWIAKDNWGRSSMANTESVEGLYVQQSNPAVQEHLFRVFTDVARRYDLDGIHFDYVRYPAKSYDFSPSTLARFREYMTPSIGPSGRAAVAKDGGPLAYVHVFPTQWADWRRAQVTGLVRRISEAVHGEKPWMQVSAAVFANVEDAYAEKGQDWRAWLSEGYLDAVCPMAYSRDTETVASQIKTAVAAAGDRHVYAGIGAYRVQAGDAAMKIARARAAGARGVNLFSYDNVTADGRSMRYLDAIRRSSFPSRAGVPGMRWRAERPVDPGDR